MNTFLQIVIVCTNQCITEIPRVFTERIVIDTEPKSFHILNHKHGGGSCVTLAEGMNLPNIRCKFCKVFHRCFNRQSLIGKLFFGGKIIIQSIFYAAPISVDNRFSVQYPFLYCQFLSGIFVPLFLQFFRLKGRITLIIIAVVDAFHIDFTAVYFVCKRTF